MTFSLDILSCDAFVTEELGGFLEIQEYCKEYALSHIPLMERRRLDQGARGVLTIIEDCQCPIVFSSFNGEINRSFKMYQTLREDSLISPTVFSLSVLNAIPALCAILFKNTHEILAISEKMSLEYGLLNAYLLLSQKETQECMVISYREVENFEKSCGVIIVAMKVARGDGVRLTLKQEECASHQQVISEANFLKHYQKSSQWISLSDSERWEWNVLS